MNREILLNWRTYFAVPLVVALLHASLNYSGFCFGKVRYLSDEEKFRILFEAFNSKETVIIRVTEGKAEYPKFYEQVKYESFEQFIEANPDCCKVVHGKPRGSPSSYLWDRITGYDSGEVLLMTFTVRYLDENGQQKAQQKKTKQILQNCGRASLRNAKYP